MTEFLFVRHGETIMNTTPDLIGGRSNGTPLTERGEQQARLVGTYLAELDRPHLIFSSGALRANTTARLALQHAGYGLPFEEDERLLEISQGSFEGTPRALAYTPENKLKYNIDSPEGKFPGGESIRDVQNRMTEFAFDVHESYPEHTVLIFGHGFSIRALAGAFRDFTTRQILDEVTDNVSLTSVSIIDGHPTVNYVGRDVIEYT